MAIGTPTEIGRATTTGTAVTSLAATLSVGTSAGDLIVVAIANHNTAAVVPTSVTDTAGNTYTLISVANSSAVSGTLAYCVNATPLNAGDTITVSYGSTRNIAMVAYTIAGIATSSAFDVSATNAQASATSLTVGPTGATAQADSIALGVFTWSNTRTFTASGGYTAGTKAESTTTIRGVILEWLILSSTGAQTATGSLNSASASANVVAVFRGAAAAPPPLNRPQNAVYRM